MGVYERMNLLRKERGITWKYLNEKVDGAYHGRMTDLKNGKTSLSLEQLETVAKILETSTDYLLGHTDDPSPTGQKEKPPAQGRGQVDPVTQELLEIVDSASLEEREMMLEMVKIITKKHREEKQ